MESRKNISIKNIQKKHFTMLRKLAKSMKMTTAECISYLLFFHEEKQQEAYDHHYSFFDVPYLKDIKLLDSFLLVDYQQKKFRVKKVTTAIFGILNRSTHEIYLGASLYYPTDLVKELNNLVKGYHMNKLLQHSYRMNRYDFYVLVFYLAPKQLRKKIELIYDDSLYPKYSSSVLTLGQLPASDSLRMKYDDLNTLIGEKNRFLGL